MRRADLAKVTICLHILHFIEIEWPKRKASLVGAPLGTSTPTAISVSYPREHRNSRPAEANHAQRHFGHCAREESPKRDAEPMLALAHSVRDA